jgi:hypothetical protein
MFSSLNKQKLDEFGEFFHTAKALYKAGRSAGYGWDMHTENVMQRGDGTLVVTDPWSV